MQHAAPLAGWPPTRPHCSKCQGQLFLDRDLQSGLRLPAEWACLQCGWRRAYTPAQFARTFAVAVGVPTADDSLS